MSFEGYTIIKIVLQANQVIIKHTCGYSKIITKNKHEALRMYNALRSIPLDVFF